MLSFGMVLVVVLDADIRFRGAFKEMCSCLQMTFWPLARGDHKRNSVEKYHQFLNKTQAIAGKYYGSHDVFIRNSKTPQYAYNSTPFDDTEVMRSVASFGREFVIPLDTELLPTPNLNTDNNQVLFKYLRDVSTNFQFAIPVLQITIEERRTAHCER